MRLLKWNRHVKNNALDTRLMAGFKHFQGQNFEGIFNNFWVPNRIDIILMEISQTGSYF